MKPEISILMPVKNASPFLEATLGSIREQDIDAWELLAVDDGSRDDSLAIVEKFSAIDQRIRSFRNEGSGIISALNLAYQKSTGAYITRMDADDLMTKDKLSSMINHLKEKGIGHVAVGYVKYFCETGIGEGYEKYADWLNNLTYQANNFSEIYKECVVPSPCWMMRRTDLDKCGSFTSNLYPEDYDLCFRMLKAGLKISPVQKTIHLWRDHALRASRNDPHYSDNRFLEIKVKYFFEMHRDRNRPLVIWGAGKKGKVVASILHAVGIDYYWITNNEKKIGHLIYDIIIKSTTEISQIDNPQILILVANPQEQKEIKNDLLSAGKKTMIDYFFFC